VTTEYDVVPYLSFPYPATHPDRLELIGHLFGMAPAPPPRSRILEIGCAAGGNLLPIAEMLPQARFVGMDLAASAIAEGNEVVRELGLANVELRHADILELDASWGTFDYIICHGVYSWVPDPVKEKLLDACAALLAPNGIALVSHNVKPGWFLRAMAREMMRYHVTRLDGPAAQTAEARVFMEFLTRTTSVSGYHEALVRERDLILPTADWYLFHDQLAPINDGCWFWEMAEKLRARGLQYLGDPHIPVMMPDLHPEAVAALAKVTDVVKTEQYHDFLTCRTFRMTAMCRAGLPLDRALTRRQIQALWLGTSAAWPADADFDSEAPVMFRTLNGAWAEIGYPPTKRALRRMRAAHPGWLPFAEICSAEDADLVALDLLACFAAGMIGGWRRPPPFVTEIGDRPHATALARLQAERGTRVTNRRHESVTLDDTARDVLVQCDGTRARGDLAEDVVKKLAESALLVA
jgi:SAM-dependent methyltransferase